MSMLQEISIQGIRSYHPHEKQIVKFQRPLTLILGQNGCGKTTIIECLKYITCSDQPKNTKTGGFVWDPKLSDHHSVKGNVKLIFRDTNDVSVVVSKTLESTQKLKTVTTRTLDQTVSRKGQSTSHKCADVDDVMCTYLGVSKSILKDVIFCHQEESSWPLDEDKKVKEKFDAIFDVGKYDKCIEQIRKEIKSIREDKKNVNKDLDYLKAYREDARNKKASLEDKKSKLAELQQKMNKIEMDMKPLEKRYNAILYIEENLSTLKNSLLTSEGHLKSIVLSKRELKSVIKLDFEGNDFELEEALNNFNNNLLQKEAEKNKLIQNKNNAIINEKRIQENISKEQINFGQYQNEEKQNLNNLQKQNIKITELGNAMEIILPALSEFNCTEVKGDLLKKLSSMKNKLESTQKEYIENEIKLQSNIDSTRVEKAKLDQEIKIQEKQIMANTSEIKKLKKVVEQVKYSSEKLTELQKLKDDNEKKLNALKESFNFDKVKLEVDKKKEEKYNINLKLDMIEKEVQKLQLLSVEQAELDTIKTNKSGIETKLQILKNKVNAILKDLLGSVPQEKLKFEFTMFLDKLSNTIRSNRNSIAAKQKQLTILEANYNHTKEKLHAHQRNVSDDENALNDMCQGQEYEVILKEVNEKIEELQDQKGSLSTSGHLFRRYIKNLEIQDPCCPLCHRSFSTIDEVTELISDLNVRVQKVPNELELTITQLETLLEKQSKLQQLKPTYTRISILNKTEIPNIKIELEKIGNNLKNKRDELSKLLEENGKLETDEMSAKNIQADVVMIDSYHNDINRLKKDEQNLVEKISESGSTRNFQEAIVEQQTLRNTSKDICNILEKRQHELNEYNETLYKLQTQQNEIVTNELNLKREMQDEKVIMDKLNDLQILEITLSSELENSKKTVQPIQKKLESFVNNLEQTKKEQNKQIENDRKKIVSFENKFQEITNLQASIDDYEKKGWSLRIKETNELLDKLSKEKMQYVEAQINIQKDIDSINDYNARQEIQKIDLENNKKLRQKLKEEIKCLSEINKLKEEVGNMDVNSLIKEKRIINENMETLFKEKNKSLGRKQELETIIENAIKELMDSRFKNAENNYLHKKVKFEILNRVENDLTKYIKALEYSLNRFHAEHMQNINTIIKKLWRDIYMGNDIDYIQIKTSDDDKPIQTDSSKRRVFNYRVVQIKNSVELDMRGRCSAGQKVLACLIVRMALAETFSKHCGILALDEPTTNLDESNIQSLAESLSEIITRRSSQKSFQLIIITHDPNFLRKLSARDMIDTYYEVERNNMGISIVNEREIRLLT